MNTSSGSLRLDRLDLRILAHLQKNGRATNIEIADAVGLGKTLMAVLNNLDPLA